MAWDNPDFTNLPVVIRWSEGGEKQKIEIHRDSITVTESGIFGKKKWLEPVPAFVRRQRNWDRWAPELKEALAHLVGDFRQRLYGVASAGFRWSFV